MVSVSRCLKAEGEMKRSLANIRVLDPATPESHRMFSCLNYILYRPLFVLRERFCLVLVSLVADLVLRHPVKVYACAYGPD